MNFNDTELLMMWALCDNCEDDQKRLINRYGRYMSHYPDIDAYSQKYAMAQARLNCVTAIKERLNAEILLRDLTNTYQMGLKE